MKILVALAIVGMSLSGCLANNTVGDADIDSEPTVKQGDFLGDMEFEETGTLLAGSTLVDDSGNTYCGEEPLGVATHVWTPETQIGGVPAQGRDGTVTLTLLSAGAVDLDLFVYDENGGLIGSSISFNPADTPFETVQVGTLLGPLTIEVRSCVGAQADYIVAGYARGVAREDHGATGKVDIEKRGDTWIASQTMTFVMKEISGAAAGSASTGAGSVVIIGSADNEYRAQFYIEGRGNTEDEARERLSQIMVRANSKAGSPFSLDDHITTKSGNWNNQVGNLDIWVPRSLAWTNLDVATIAGTVSVQNLNTERLDAGTSAGTVQVDRVSANNMDLSTSAGSIDANMEESTQSGSWNLETSAGAIDLRLIESASLGYDVEGETSAGDVSLNFDDAPVSESDCEYASCYKRATTNGFATRGIQVQVNMETSAGYVNARS